MYDAQLTIDRIQKLIKSQNLVQKDVLTTCGIGINTLKNMKSNKGMGCFTLATLADFLNTSTDYLLGRADEPYMTITVTQTGEIIEQSPINAVNNSEKIDQTAKQLLDLFNKLDIIGKARVLEVAVKEANK